MQQTLKKCRILSSMFIGTDLRLLKFIKLDQNEQIKVIIRNQISNYINVFLSIG